MEQFTKHVEGQFNGQETAGNTRQPASFALRWKQLKAARRLASEHEIHANLSRAWKRQLLEDGPCVFATNGERKQREQEAQKAELHVRIRSAAVCLRSVSSIASSRHIIGEPLFHTSTENRPVQLEGAAKISLSGSS